MERKMEKPFEEYFIPEEPYYLPSGMWVSFPRPTRPGSGLLKGPTGCGKTRFVEYMTYRLGKEMGTPLPLITVACHEDLTGSDLVGRYLLKERDLVDRWAAGPGGEEWGHMHLDEIVEARKDTTVLIHPWPTIGGSPVEKRADPGGPREFSPGHLLQPGYQSVLKNLKHSTRQRFVPSI
jgi:nitric oxide reductase NorQ protein